MTKNRSFDVVVVGGGHAGIEAAAAAARMGSLVALVTIARDKIGSMQCNPSVGGLGKGHLTFEVSAFGGVMPSLCSKTYLQAKMLNTSKGPAVQGLRLQIDKISYQNLASQTMQNYPGVTVIQGEVTDIFHNESQGIKEITGVVIDDGETILTKTLVITTGTFLNSAIYVGKDRCYPLQKLTPSSNKLTGAIEKLIELKLGRLKTGTPPRILKSSVNFDVMEKQPTYPLDYLFEFDPIEVKEIEACFVTHTNQKTCEIISKNISSAGYNPTTKGMEPRYCPSLETKISRFPDKYSHHVFIEPESQFLDEIYPAGVSNSLPQAVQEEFIRTIPGLENAVLTKPAYMIEYDFLQPNNLKHSLEHKQVKGLFFAGQVNGTTGYEEAAGQGLVAGINASLCASNKDPFILSRQDSYIGVMIDDLVSLGVDEPYRMFTSRAERRLILRQDNVFQRLSPAAYKLGLISKEMFDKVMGEKTALEMTISLLDSGWGRSELFNLLNLVTLEQQDKERILEILKTHAVSQDINPESISPRIITMAHAHTKYKGYLAREELEIKKFEKYADESIPKDFGFSGIAGLSTELTEKLNKFRPENIAQAQLIPGITPAAISLLIFRVRQFKEGKFQTI